MRNFQDIFETPKQSFINAVSIYMTVNLTSDMEKGNNKANAP